MSEDIKDIEEILELAKEEIENNDENITATLDLQDLKSLRNLYNLYNKEKEKNKKAIEMLQEEIRFCEQEAKGHLNNEICHIALRFDKHLLQELLEGENE